MSASGQVEVQHRTVAFLNTIKSLQALGGLSQTAEAKVLKAHDTTVGDSGEIHRVVPDVMVVLHPLVTVGAARHETGITGRVVLIGRQTEDLETLRGDFCACIFVAVGSLGRPFIVFGIGVITRNLHHAALCHRLLVPGNLYRSHHGLTGKAEATWGTVVEHIPLTIDLLNRTMGVVACIGGDEL